MVCGLSLEKKKKKYNNKVTAPIKNMLLRLWEESHEFWTIIMTIGSQSSAQCKLLYGGCYEWAITTKMSAVIGNRNEPKTVD